MPVHEGFALRDGMVFLLTFFSIDASLSRSLLFVPHPITLKDLVSIESLRSVRSFRVGVIATRSEQRRLSQFLHSHRIALPQKPPSEFSLCAIRLTAIRPVTKRRSAKNAQSKSAIVNPHSEIPLNKT